MTVLTNNVKFLLHKNKILELGVKKSVRRTYNSTKKN